MLMFKLKIKTVDHLVMRSSCGLLGFKMRLVSGNSFRQLTLGVVSQQIRSFKVPHIICFYCIQYNKSMHVNAVLLWPKAVEIGA